MIFNLPSVGFIDPESKQIPVTTNTFFDFASLTKLFANTAFLRLVRHNVIDSIDKAGYYSLE